MTLIHPLFISMLFDNLNLEVTSEALDGGSRDNGFRCATDAVQEVNTAVWQTGGDGPGYVTIIDELDTNAKFTELGDDVAVPWPIEDTCNYSVIWFAGGNACFPNDNFDWVVNVEFCLFEDVLTVSQLIHVEVFCFVETTAAGHCDG